MACQASARAVVDQHLLEQRGRDHGLAQVFRRGLPSTVRSAMECAVR
jgi:hypothetical protein